MYVARGTKDGGAARCRKTCAKSSKHLCKHMAFFQACRQCSHRLKIDVQGNIPCPRAMLGWLWTSEEKKEDKEKACRFKQYPLSIFRCGSAAEENAASSFLSDLFVSVQINHSCWVFFFWYFFGCKSQTKIQPFFFFFFYFNRQCVKHVLQEYRLQFVHLKWPQNQNIHDDDDGDSHTQLTPCRQRGGV